MNKLCYNTAMMKKEKNTKVVELTQDSHRSLQAELKDLRDHQLPAVIDRIAKARDQGDLSENSEYKDAKDQQELLEVRMGEIEEILAQAKIVKETTDDSKIGLGSKVTIKDDHNRQATYEIIGEFDKDAGREDTISAVSPLGSALMGKKNGDAVTIDVPAGQRTVKILKIS